MPLPDNGVRGSVTLQQSGLKCQRIHQVAGAWLVAVVEGLKSQVIKQEGNEIIYRQNRSS